MKTKRILAIAVFFIFSTALFPGEKEPIPIGIEYTVGLNFSYDKVPVILGEPYPGQTAKPGNTLNFSFLALEADAIFSDYITLGLVAGYSAKHFKNPVDFDKMPLTLRLNDQDFKSLVLGLRAKSDFYTWNYFTFRARGEFLYFMNAKRNLPIRLPIVEGNGVVKNSFTQAAVELLAQYEGLPNFNVYAGPQFNILKGKFNASETIEALEGAQTLTYKQKHAVGVVGGIRFEAGNFDIDAKITLITKTAASIEVFYIF